MDMAKMGFIVVLPREPFLRSAASCLMAEVRCGLVVDAGPMTIDIFLRLERFSAVIADKSMWVRKSEVSFS